MYISRPPFLLMAFVFLTVSYTAGGEPAPLGGRVCSWWRSTARAEEPSPEAGASHAYMGNPSCTIQCICVLIQCIYSVSASSPDTEQIQSQIQSLVYTQDILCYPGIIVGYCCLYLKILWDILVCGLVWALAL